MKTTCRKIKKIIKKINKKSNNKSKKLLVIWNSQICTYTYLQAYVYAYFEY